MHSFLTSSRPRTLTNSAKFSSVRGQSLATLACSNRVEVHGEDHCRIIAYQSIRDSRKSPMSGDPGELEILVHQPTMGTSCKFPIQLSVSKRRVTRFKMRFNMAGEERLS